MKLAEALVLRADTQRRIQQLQARIQESSLVQEGSDPPEDPEKLLGELSRLISEFEQWVVRINRTNIRITLPNGKTIMEALAQRDALQLHHNALASVVMHASTTVSRYSKTEIRNIATIDVGALREQMDTLARDRRQLDIQIQTVNWATEVEELPPSVSSPVKD
jgi:hypothetical protein